MRVICMLMLLFVSCNHSNYDQNKIGNSLTDSLKIQPKFNSFSLKAKGIDTLFNNYYNRFGISITKYYSVWKYFGIDLNHDGVIDTIVLLSPICLDNTLFSDLDVEDTAKRIIVEIKYDKYGAKIRKTHRDLLNNTGGLLAIPPRITRFSDGFSMLFEKGSRYRWSYSLFYSVKNSDQLKLNKIVKKCFFDTLSNREEYIGDLLDINTIKVHDSLVLNCNCDKMWQEEENRIEKNNY